MNGEMIIAIVAGLILGLVVAYINTCLTRKNMMNSKAGVLMGINAVRMLLDVAALALGYFGGSYLGWPLFPLLISIAVGLSIGGMIFLKVMLNKLNRNINDKPREGEPVNNIDNQERGE